MIIRTLRGIIIVLLCVATLAGCNNMKFDQTTSKNDLLTIKYSINQIEKLRSSAKTNDVTFSKFKRDFNPQCIRKTHQGYYVVLLLEDGGNAFVLFNDENSLISVIVSNGFKSKIEFQNKLVEQMPLSEVLNFDSNAILLPISAMDITAHIVQEGILIVKYSRYKDEKNIEDPIVTSIEFIDNESLSNSEDPFIKYVIPFILELDKVEK